MGRRSCSTGRRTRSSRTRRTPLMNADGSSGVYKKAESIEAISVTASDAASGGVLRAGGKAMIKARVFAFQTGAEDMADFYYTSSPGDPVWTYVGSATPSSGGFVNVQSEEFPLPKAGMQAVRVNYRWIGESMYASSCSGGSFDDVDDLIFTVDTTSAGEIDSAAIPDHVGAPQPLVIQINCAQHEMERCVAAEQFCEWRENLFSLGLKGLGNKKSCHPLSIV